MAWPNARSRPPARSACPCAARLSPCRDSEMELERRGTTILPDFVANAAAAFLFCGLLEKRLEPSLESIFGVTSRQLRTITRELLDRARRERVSNRRAAEEIAEQRLRERA